MNRPSLTLAPATAGDAPLRVVQITDSHLFGEPERALLGVPTAASFAAVVEQVRSDEGCPDLILVTGDISQDDSRESYRAFAQTMTSFACPVACFAGNHDDRDGMALCLEPLRHWRIRQLLAPGWQLLLLESQVEGHTYGRVSADELEFVRAAVASQPQRRTMLFLHHPPLPVGCNWLDQHRLRNGEELLAVAAQLGVVAIVSGHVHQDFRASVGGVEVLTTPSTCIQFLPRSEQFKLDSASPGYRTFELWPDGRWQTQVKRLADHRFSPQFDSAGY